MMINKSIHMSVYIFRSEMIETDNYHGKTG